MPFDCGSVPVLFETLHGLIVIQGLNCGHFKIKFDVLQWKIARLIWIAFYKNTKNDKCVIDRLPKDVINFILTFVGRNYRAVEDKTAFDKVVFG